MERWERSKARHARRLAETGIPVRNISAGTRAGNPSSVFYATKHLGSAARTMLHSDVRAESGLNVDDPGTLLLHHIDPDVDLRETDVLICPADGDAALDRYQVAFVFVGELGGSDGATHRTHQAAICHQAR